MVHVLATSLTHHPFVKCHGQLWHHQHPQHPIQLVPVGRLGGGGQRAAAGVDDDSLYVATISIVAEDIEGIDARGQGDGMQPCRQHRQPQGQGAVRRGGHRTIVPAGCASPPALSRAPAAATHSARRTGSSTMCSTRWSSSSTADHSAPSSLKGSRRMKPSRLTCSSSAQAQWVAAALGLPLQAARVGKVCVRPAASPADCRAPAAKAAASAWHLGSEPAVALLQEHASKRFSSASKMQRPTDQPAFLACCRACHTPVGPTALRPCPERLGRVGSGSSDQPGCKALAVTRRMARGSNPDCRTPTSRPLAAPLPPPAPAGRELTARP
jgi:hypothetical protein